MSSADDFTKIMNYWMLDVKQAGHDLMGIIFFTPIITVAVSGLIFGWFFTQLSRHSAVPSIREQSWKLFFSLYAVASCWMFIFGVCLLLVAPAQVYKSQSKGLAQQSSTQTTHNGEPKEFQRGTASDYAEHSVKR